MRAPHPLVSATSLYDPYTIRLASFYAVNEPTPIGELQLRRSRHTIPDQ
jgi:hypothetical protein